MSRILLAALLLIGCGFGPVAVAQTKATEMAGAKDHPMVSRYASSVLQSTAQENFVALRIPGGPGRFGAGDKLVFEKSTAVEGRLSSYFYIQPKDRTALDVFRNYQAALQQSGFTTLSACEMQDCDKALIKEQFANEAVRPRKWAPDDYASSSISRDVRFVSAKASRNGADVFVMVYVAEPNSIWQAPVAVVLVAEPAALETGKVVIGTDKLQRGLADEGKIALYSLYFDTAKAEVKPESKPQLAEMAKLLQANKALSQKRAEAVVAALVTDHKTDVARLRARGVANFSPVTSNGSEAGRAKNRRVELVEQ